MDMVASVQQWAEEHQDPKLGQMLTDPEALDVIRAYADAGGTELTIRVVCLRAKYAASILQSRSLLATAVEYEMSICGWEMLHRLVRVARALEPWMGPLASFAARESRVALVAALLEWIPMCPDGHELIRTAARLRDRNLLLMLLDRVEDLCAFKGAIESWAPGHRAYVHYGCRISGRWSALRRSWIAAAVVFPM